MSIQNYPSVDYIKSILRYENGKLYWLDRPCDSFANEWTFRNWIKRHLGKEAGHQDKRNGRWHVKIQGVILFRYHIVWAIHHGYWPDQLDHADLDTMNDRIENLRECTDTQNQANRRKSKANTSGFKGVSWNRGRGKWMAMISRNCRNKNLGYFDTPEEAYQAYLKAAREQWGEFHRPE